MSSGASRIRCRNTTCRDAAGSRTVIAVVHRLTLLRRLTTTNAVEVSIRESGEVEIRCPRCGWVTPFRWEKRESA